MSADFTFAKVCVCVCVCVCVSVCGGSVVSYFVCFEARGIQLLWKSLGLVSCWDHSSAPLWKSDSVHVCVCVCVCVERERERVCVCMCL